MKQANLIIFRSPNGRDNWQPVKPEDVPAWVRQPDTVRRMVEGEECMNVEESDQDWFRAEIINPDVVVH